MFLFVSYLYSTLDNELHGSRKCVLFIHYINIMQSSVWLIIYIQ